MRPRIEELIEAVGVLGSGIVKYFPADAKVREIIVRDMESMVPTVAALNWLVEQYVRKIGEWHSLKELRGVLCAYCDPLDGIQAVSEIPGYTPQDCEQRYIETKSLETSRQLSTQKQLPEYVDPAVEEELRKQALEIEERIKARKKPLNDKTEMRYGEAARSVLDQLKKGIA